ncbi:LysM peptidoglycan-binding domain-containing protein [Xylanimonas allomyrinae]|uniref:LysM peptidoglycan-binding domain-containing protein n=1 Tax=Xylanimonas allomyrinae TaxID=2509459 RepID=A0A4P6ELL8_9MICO|nr:LysM peptidoglycan-binding domain-containing protein [Xylanimonas allomyrinae]QAY63532.1 LysM peptidoglycan-binding domain-containing protein [Xylanimonas allomyrinae]
MTFRRRAAGVAATLGILALVVGVPTLLVWAYRRLWTFTWSELWVRAQMPDDGTLVIALVQVVAWVAWAYLAWGLVLEAVYRVRGMSAPRVRGLGLSQGAARRLIDAAAMLFVVVPATPIVAAPAHAVASASTGRPAPIVATAALAAPIVERTSTPVVAPVETTPPPPATFDYTVKRNESLWKIAERNLGHGAEWTQIRDLNRDVIGDNPSFIEPGMVLRIPQTADQPPGAGGTYVVEPGDTLSAIAEEQLGDANRYPEIYAASTQTTQPDGEHLNDPDLIRPGWTLTIPGPALAEAVDETDPHAGLPQQAASSAPEPTPTPSGTASTPSGTASPGETRVPAETRRPDRGNAADAPADPTADPTAPPSPDDQPDSAEMPAWLVPGLAGAGGILAGALLLTVGARRRTAARRRETGMMLPPLPPELQATARTAAAVGQAPSEAVSHLTGMLAAVAAASPDRELPPSVVTAIIDRSDVVLTLVDDAVLPAPWDGDGTSWRAPLTATDPVECDAPYPLLVPVGSDGRGRIHLVNLERLGTLSLVGDHDHVAAFARFLAASVALNPWSARVHVYALGVLEEMADIDHLRLRYFPSGDTMGIDEANQAVADASSTSADNYLLVLTAAPGDTERNLAASIAGHPGRSPVVLVSLGAEIPGSARAEITDVGRLRIASLGIDVEAPGLTRDEAEACAAVVAATDAATSVPIPVDDAATKGWQVHANLAGALRPELVADRPVDIAAPAGESSLLPAAAAEYAATAPVTTDDVAVLAPLVREGVRATVEEDLDDLDRDIALFGKKPPRRPWIRLLGPVEAAGCGDRTAAPYRDSTRLETFAYLTLHPRGATAAELKEAGIAGNSIAQRTTELRTWLGRDPETGRQFLPNAHASPDHGKAGLVYQLEGCLCDINLFRALRVRGEARGGEGGIADLVAALGLVKGIPFAQAPGHFTWVFEGERLDHIMTIAILEVASIVIAHALATGDLATARFAAEAAHRAAPDDDQAKLDLIAVAAREGHGDTAALQMLDAIGATSEDYRSPIDPSNRTKAIIARLRTSADAR